MTTTNTTDLVTSPATWGYEQGKAQGLTDAAASAFSRRIVAAHYAGQRACATGHKRPAVLARRASDDLDCQAAFRAGYRHAANRVREAKAAGVAYVKSGGDAPGHAATRRYEEARPKVLSVVLFNAFRDAALHYMARRGGDMHRKREARDRVKREGVDAGVAAWHACVALSESALQAARGSCRYKHGSDYWRIWWRYYRKGIDAMGPIVNRLEDGLERPLKREPLEAQMVANAA